MLFKHIGMHFKALSFYAFQSVITLLKMIEKSHFLKKSPLCVRHCMYFILSHLIHTVDCDRVLRSPGFPICEMEETIRATLQSFVIKWDIAYKALTDRA